MGNNDKIDKGKENTDSRLKKSDVRAGSGVEKLAIQGGTPVRTAPFHPWPVFALNGHLTDPWS